MASFTTFTASFTASVTSFVYFIKTLPVFKSPCIKPKFSLNSNNKQEIKIY